MTRADFIFAKVETMCLFCFKARSIQGVSIREEQDQNRVFYGLWRVPVSIYAFRIELDPGCLYPSDGAHAGYRARRVILLGQRAYRQPHLG